MNTSNAASENIDEHAAAVYGWAYRVLGRHHDALDVSQDVMLRWVKQSRDEIPRSVRAWLRRVTVNRALDLLRRRRPEESVDLNRRDEQLPGERPDQSDAIDLRLLRSDIGAALMELSDQQRSVLVAKTYDGMTFAELAAELDISPSTAKTHYLRALRVLRDRLQPRWGND